MQAIGKQALDNLTILPQHLDARIDKLKALLLNHRA